MIVRIILATLVLTFSPVAPVSVQAQTSGEKALLVGRIETVKAAEKNGFYDLNVVVLKVLSGKDPGEYARVRVKAETADLEGQMITLLIDPDLNLGAPGQSWWAASNFPEPECIPKDLVAGAAFEDFRAKGVEQNGKYCVKL